MNAVKLCEITARVSGDFTKVHHNSLLKYVISPLNISGEITYFSSELWWIFVRSPLTLAAILHNFTEFTAFHRKIMYKISGEKITFHRLSYIFFQFFLDSGNIREYFYYFPIDKMYQSSFYWAHCKSGACQEDTWWCWWCCRRLLEWSCNCVRCQVHTHTVRSWNQSDTHSHTMHASSQHRSISAALNDKSCWLNDAKEWTVFNLGDV